MKYFWLLLIPLLGACGIQHTANHSNHYMDTPILFQNELPQTDTFYCSLQDVLFEDSILVTFLAIEFDERAGATNILPKDLEVYRTFFGPISVGSWNKPCPRYNLFFRGNTGYFLVDEFTDLTDSLTTVSISGGTGYYMQSNMRPLLSGASIPSSALHPDLKDEIHVGILATEKWYKQWKKDHPRYQDTRITNNRGTDCE